MNILRVLASGDGTINEPNISALLGYLLDPSEDHGISGHLLNSILKDFDVKLPGRIARDKLECSVDLEVRLNFGDGDEKEKKRKKKRRDLDVLVTFYKKGEKDPRYVLGIENKINDGALQPDQLKDEWDGLKRKFPASTSTRYLCFLTLPTKTKKGDVEKADAEFQAFIDSAPDATAKHLYWKRPIVSCSTGRAPSQSLSEKLCDILEKERCGEIDPIPVESVCFIKSLLSFIRTDFQTETKQDRNERRDFEKPVWQHFEDAIKKYGVDEDIDFNELLENVREQLRLICGDKNIDKKATLNKLIVNLPSRCGNGVTDGNHKKYDLLYYPNPDNVDIVRRYNEGNPPPKIKIFCTQNGQKGFIDPTTGAFQPDNSPIT